MLGLLVEPEVRRPDDDDRVGADLGGVRRERDGLRSRLRAALDGHLQPAVGGLQEEVGDATPLASSRQDPLPGRPERQDPVEPGGDEEVDERLERVLVELAARVAKRRHRRGERAAKRRHQRCGLALAHALDRARDPTGTRLGALRLLDPLDVLAPVRERHLAKRLRQPDRPRAPPGGRPGRRTVRGFGVELHLDPHPVAGVDSRRRLHGAVDDDVPHAVVHAGRRPPGVAADRDLDRRPRAAESLLQVERHAEHRRRLLHPLELHGEALRGHVRNHMVSGDGGLRVERDGDVLRVTLARPERRNAFDAALIAELTEAFADVGDARAVVLSGEGPSFCAGADVEWQRSSIDLSYDENVEDAMRLYRMLEAIDSCPAPGRLRRARLCARRRLGPRRVRGRRGRLPDAVFGFTEVRLGIIPAVISPFVLPGSGSAARRYFVTGERFGADVALRIGLVQEVAEDAGGRREAIVEAILARAGPRRCARRSGSSGTARTGIETARDRSSPATSAEGQEGLRAFLEEKAAAVRPGAGSATRPSSRARSQPDQLVPGEDDRRRGALTGAVVTPPRRSSRRDRGRRPRSSRVVRALSRAAVVAAARCERSRVEAVDRLAIVAPGRRSAAPSAGDRRP